MDVEIERQIDRRMAKQFADRLAVTASLDTARRKCVTERVEPNMREIVPCKEAVVELAICANFRTLDIAADEIALSVFFAKPFQYRQKNWRKRDFTRRCAALGCGYDNLRLARAIQLLSIDALNRLTDMKNLVFKVDVLTRRCATPCRGTRGCPRSSKRNPNRLPVPDAPDPCGQEEVRFRFAALPEREHHRPCAAVPLPASRLEALF